MNAETCIICGAVIPEGRQVCPQCEEKFKPNAEIFAAMLNKSPVEHDGIKYGCVSAFTIRVRSSHLYAMKEPYVAQVELISRNGSCRVIADPQEVKILREGQK